ncbi:MAG: hypothetical protein U0Q11_11185 [Vicinamibacterales bacterium]
MPTSNNDPTTLLTRLTIPTRRRVLITAAVSLATCSLLAAGCRPTAPVQTLPPLGPGTAISLNVPGAQALAPRVAASSPFVAIAFGTHDSRGAMVYVALSADNGATFSEPEPVTAEGRVTGTPESVQVSLDTAAAGKAAAPAVTVAWRLQDGRTQTRVVRPWSGAPADASHSSDPPTAAATCTPDGEVLLVAGHRGPSDVSVNHSLENETCRTRLPAAVIDARQWAHVAWIAGDDEASTRVLYAASSDREWFGGSQRMVDAGQRPDHLTLITDPNDTVVATWDGEAAGDRQVYLRQILPAHHGPATMLPVTRLGEPGSVSPASASIKGGVIVSWLDTRTGSVVVRRVGLDAICETAPSVPANGPSSGVSAP